MSLLVFTSRIASALVKAGKAPTVGRQSKRKSIEQGPPLKRKPSVPLPCDDCRFDGFHHWPEYRPKKGDR